MGQAAQGPVGTHGVVDLSQWRSSRLSFFISNEQGIPSKNLRCECGCHFNAQHWAWENGAAAQTGAGRVAGRVYLNRSAKLRSAVDLEARMANIPARDYIAYGELL